ncbi:MAG: hypothetical protein WBR28_09630, partial [Mycobacterium sp.]
TAAAGDALALAWRRPGEPGCEYGVKGCGGQGREMRRAKVMPGRRRRARGRARAPEKRGPANPLVVERLAGDSVKTSSWLSPLVDEQPSFSVQASEGDERPQGGCDYPPVA